MDDIVALRAKSRRDDRYFLTWGRVHDAADPAPLITVVTKHLPNFGIAPNAKLEVCTMQEAAKAPFFYECFFAMTQRRIDWDNYASWRAHTAAKMDEGREIWFLGH